MWELSGDWPLRGTRWVSLYRHLFRRSLFLQFQPCGLEFALLGHRFLFSSHLLPSLQGLFWCRLWGGGTLTPWSPTGKDFLLSFGLLRRAVSLVPSYEMPPGLARCPQTRVTGRTPLDLPPVKHSLQPSHAPILQMRTLRPASSGWDSYPGHRASSWA